MLDPKNVYVSMSLYEMRVSLIGACNHNCFYCGPFSDGKYDNGYGVLDITHVPVIANLVAQHKLHVQLTGGEVSLRKDLVEIVKLFVSAGIPMVGMSSNASLLDIHKMKLLTAAGLGDLHLHVPSFDFVAFAQTVQKSSVGQTIQNIKDISAYALENNVRLEFNTPVTEVNIGTLDAQLDFCYEHGINQKLIEEVSVQDPSISLDQIKLYLQDWMEKRDISVVGGEQSGRYGIIYDFGGFFFRIAPATQDLVGHLRGEKKKVLLDGRFWVGGKSGKYLYTPSYFLTPEMGEESDFRRVFNETLALYRGGK